MPSPSACAGDVYCIATVQEINPSASLHQESVMIVSYILSKIRAWRLYRETIRELSQLSDRELNDVGLSRWEIPYVAKKYSNA